jgi:hypothetical protein
LHESYSFLALVGGAGFTLGVTGSARGSLLAFRARPPGGAVSNHSGHPWVVEMKNRRVLIVSGSVFACGFVLCAAFLVFSYSMGSLGSKKASRPTVFVLEPTMAGAPTEEPVATETPLQLGETAPSDTPSAQDTPLPQMTAISTKSSPLALQERRLAVLEWPSSIHLGDSDVLTLTLLVDQAGKLTPMAQIGGHKVTGQTVYIPDLYDSYNLVAVARLDLAGVQISPQGMVSQPMRPGRDIFFSWSISPDQLGQYRGTLWLYLNLVPKNGGNPDQLTLLAPEIQIESVSVLGLPGPVARWGGVAGTSLSIVFGFPFIESLLLKLWKWIRGK